MPHFFIKSDKINENFIEIDDENIFKHVVKSLRMKLGEKILLIDENKIQYEGRINEISKSTILVENLKSYKSQKDLDFDLYLAQTPLLKSDSQLLLVEKATELGIRGIYPIFTDFCAVKKSVIENKIQKYQKIMFEASKQCERATIPTCFDLIELKKLLEKEKFSRILAFVERRGKFKLKNYLRENPIKKNEKILVIIGAEGGFSEREIDFFEQNGIITLSLGELILKAETAVVVALGNIVYEYDG